MPHIATATAVAVAALPWTTIAHALVSLCAVVWLGQQMHDSVRKELSNLMATLSRALIWTTCIASVAYLGYTMVDWSHVSQKTAHAGLQAFVVRGPDALAS